MNRASERVPREISARDGRRLPTLCSVFARAPAAQLRQCATLCSFSPVSIYLLFVLPG